MEKAKWEKSGRSKRLRVMSGFGGASVSPFGPCEWASRVGPLGGWNYHPSEEAAKAYAEAELRRVLTEAIERLP